ncbi:MAG: hypothetical protein KC776_25320 [Myxococcales bacterium]|nr:hypothetical protein [Myxococcales bacterium]MCB9581799.1 hypothetical protein [Polyangiaceae bacterium]
MESKAGRERVSTSAETVQAKRRSQDEIDPSDVEPRHDEQLTLELMRALIVARESAR